MESIKGNQIWQTLFPVALFMLFFVYFQNVFILCSEMGLQLLLM